MRWLLLILCVAGCPKKAPKPIVFAPASRTVEGAADITGANGIAATVVGKLERRQPLGQTTEGTAIVLNDGTPVFVSETPPPADWEWMLGTMVRVQGVLWEHPQSGWQVPKLLEAETPMPADVSILMDVPP